MPSGIAQPAPAHARCELIPGLLEFGTHRISLAQQFLVLRAQRLRHRGVAIAGLADQRVVVFLRRAEGTAHRRKTYGATLSVMLVVPVRPSVSLISTRSTWSPGGSTVSGISIPEACTNGLTRLVRSTSGDLR